MEGERLYTVQQVAERLGAHEETIRRWLKAGRIHGVMPGGQKLGYRIPESEVARILGGASPALDNPTSADAG